MGMKEHGGNKHLHQTPTPRHNSVQSNTTPTSDHNTTQIRTLQRRSAAPWATPASSSPWGSSPRSPTRTCRACPPTSRCVVRVYIITFCICVLYVCRFTHVPRADVHHPSPQTHLENQNPQKPQTHQQARLFNYVPKDEFWAATLGFLSYRIPMLAREVNEILQRRKGGDTSTMGGSVRAGTCGFWGLLYYVDICVWGVGGVDQPDSGMDVRMAIDP